MKYIIKRILKFCEDTIMFIYFLLKLIRQKSIFNPIKKKYTGTVAVLASGPSLKNILPDLAINTEFKNIDFIVMNFFAFDDIFFKIKPKHYCFADPGFVQDNSKKDDVLRLFTIFQEKITWDINIYIPSKSYYKKFLSYNQLTNSFLHYIPLNSIEYQGYEFLRFFFYQKGLSMPRAQTVANMAIYVGLNNAYSEIQLYGVDHNFLNALCINEYNQLCNKLDHFYDKEVKLEPLLRSDNGSIWKIADYLEAISNMMKSHDLLANYAKFLRVKIINFTKVSMIDSYERKK